MGLEDRVKWLDSKIALKKEAGDPTSAWINNDIRPLPPSRRTWTKFNYISFWAM